MNRQQRGLAFILASVEIDRETFGRSYPLDLLDAGVNKGYVTNDRGTYRVTESGQRFIHDEGNPQ